MATSADVSDPLSEYSDILTPSNVAQFLATRKWTIQRDRNFDQVWVLESARGTRPVSLLLPREPSFVDYSKRLREAVRAIMDTYGIALPELVEQVASIHADLFFVRVDQSMNDGTIPLRQATSLLENIDQMIRAAAVAAHNPQSSGRGRTPEYVNDFLNDDVRMGHTKKGSFIITVAARIDHGETDRPPAESPDEVESENAPSFARQVMTTLAKSLDVTRRFATDRGEFEDVEEAIDQGLKLQVVQALQEMGGTEGLNALDLSFEWAAAEPQRTAVPTHMSIDRGIIDELPEIEQRLVRNTVPQRVTIVGPVKELKQDDDDGVPESEQGGEVVVHAEIGGRMRRITIPLGPVDHDWAIRAYRARLPFTVTGELVKRRNTWRLDEPIEVDRSFLEYRSRSLDHRTRP